MFWENVFQACTLSSPAEGPLRKNAPSWCRAPFEPEGLLRFYSQHKSMATHNFSSTFYFAFCFLIWSLTNKNPHIIFHPLSLYVVPYQLSSLVSLASTMGMSWFTSRLHTLHNNVSCPCTCSHTKFFPCKFLLKIHRVIPRGSSNGSHLGLSYWS